MKEVSDRASVAFTYALDLLAQLAGLPADLSRRVLHYGPGAGACSYVQPALHILASDFFEEAIYGSARSLPSLPLREIERVPLLFGSPGIERRGNCLLVHADIVASAYFLVTRYEEMVRRDVRDQYGRFPGRESLPYRAGFLHRPIVEEYAALLRKWLGELGVDVPGPRREFSLLLTHDVDLVRKYRRALQPLRVTASALLGRQPFTSVRESWAVALGCMEDPYLAAFEQLFALDASLQVAHRSVYFFMGGGCSPRDSYYSLNAPDVQRALRQVTSSGAEVGLHASYEASEYPSKIKAEKEALERALGHPVQGNRHHYLTWREIEDGWHLAVAGITWDSTLGYADVAGFRLGVCHPIPLFDPTALKPMGIMEHPLIVMDCTLDRTTYMGLDEEGAFRYCARLMDETRKHAGEFVMLWHNTSLAPARGSYHPRLYRRLLAYADAGGAEI